MTFGRASLLTVAGVAALAAGVYVLPPVAIAVFFGVVWLVGLGVFVAYVAVLLRRPRTAADVLYDRIDRELDRDAARERQVADRLGYSYPVTIDVAPRDCPVQARRHVA